MLVILGEGTLAKDVIHDVLREEAALSEPFRVQLGRAWGRVLVEHDQAELVGEMQAQESPYALPEIMAFAFSSRSPLAKET